MRKESIQQPFIKLSMVSVSDLHLYIYCLLYWEIHLFFIVRGIAALTDRFIVKKDGCSSLNSKYGITSLQQIERVIRIIQPNTRRSCPRFSVQAVQILLKYISLWNEMVGK